MGTERKFDVEVEAGILQEAVYLIAAMEEEAKLEISKRGIVVKETDSSHVAMVEINLKPEAFKRFDVGDDLELGIDTNRMKDVLRCIPQTEGILRLTLEKRELVIGKKKEKIEKLVARFGPMTRTLRLVDLSGRQEVRTPQLDLPASAKLPTADLRAALHALSAITDHVIFTLTAKGLVVEGESDAEEVKFEFPADKLHELKVPAQGVYRSVFPLDYMATFAKAITSGSVTLRLGEEYPCRIEFPIAGGRGTGAYLVAPRIEND